TPRVRPGAADARGARPLGGAGGERREREEDIRPPASAGGAARVRRLPRLLLRLEAPGRPRVQPARPRAESAPPRASPLREHTHPRLLRDDRGHPAPDPGRVRGARLLPRLLPHGVARHRRVPGARDAPARAGGGRTSRAGGDRRSGMSAPGPPAAPAVAALLAITAAGTAAYWIAFFAAGNALHSSETDAYVAFEHAFPAAGPFFVAYFWRHRDRLGAAPGSR